MAQAVEQVSHLIQWQVHEGCHRICPAHGHNSVICSSNQCHQEISHLRVMGGKHLNKCICQCKTSQLKEWMLLLAMKILYMQLICKGGIGTLFQCLHLLRKWYLHLVVKTETWATWELDRTLEVICSNITWTHRFYHHLIKMIFLWGLDFKGTLCLLSVQSKHR